MAEPKTTRIVLLGKTGAGKSSLANTIFRDKLFEVLPGFISVTSVCEAKTKSVNGRKLTLIDTPGFFDTDRSEEEMKREIVRCITECSPGPHAFLIVFKLDRFTEQKEAVIHKMTEYFSEDVYKYTTVVFTHGQELPKGEKIQDLVKQNKSLSDFIEKCGGRCHVIDNKHWNTCLTWKGYRSNKFQVNEILKSIDKTVEANNGNCYMNEMLQITEELIQQEEKRIAETSENMSKEEIRTAAKNKVNKMLTQAAGITVGALLGALFGVVLPVVLVTAGITGGMKSAVGKAAALTLGAETVGAGGVGGLGVAGAAGEAGAVGVAGAAEGAGGAGALGVAVAVGVARVARATGGAGAAGVAEVAGVAGAGATGGVIGTGLTVVGVLAAVGAGFGGVEGYQAAQAAENPWEAAEMAAKAVCFKGMKAVNGAKILASQLKKEVECTPSEEKDSKCKTLA